MVAVTRHHAVAAALLAAAITLAACGTGNGAARPAGSATSASAGTRPERIVPVPKSVLAAAVPQPSGTMWTLAGGAGNRRLFEVEMPGGQVVGSVRVSSDAQAVTQSLTGLIGLAIATRGGGALELLDGTTARVVRTVRLPAPARDVVIGSDGTTFYVLTGTAAASTVTVVNSQNGMVRGTVPVPPQTVSLVPDVQQTTLYVLQGDGHVSQISLVGGKVLASFVAGRSGRSLALSPDGNTLYVLKDVAGAANVAVVDVATESVLRVLPAPSHCREVLVSASGSQLYEVVGTADYGNIQVFAA
jgi:DNA-binding beta-propeller fold protein YncE